MRQTELVVVLVVEDEELIQEVIRDALTEGGFKTRSSYRASWERYPEIPEIFMTGAAA